TGHSGHTNKKERVMKKLLLVLIMLALVLPAFADDAKVLPKGVLRTYIVPVYSFATGQYNEDGDLKDFTELGQPTDKLTAFNLGGAIEYGVNEWISAAVQWTPGYTFGATFKSDGTIAGDFVEESYTVQGPAEVFIGAKMQIVGEQAPVQNDMFRAAFAPGVMLPTAFGYDPEEEAAKTLGTGDEINLGASKNATGLGARFYADYIINKMFFLNLYSQFKYFFPVDTAKTDLAHYNPAADEVDYGYELTVEAEPHFNTMVADGVELSVGVPFTYVTTPDVKYDDTEAPDSATNSLYVKPSVSTFLMKLPLPMEFKVGYEYPIMGTNIQARNNVVFQIKTYMKF
ncbi:MAG: hypothetical protein K9M94_09925, partial [Spirochaetia bacterium]|nr:hypothetical protein [Spirochaetia bacterium]